MAAIVSKGRGANKYNSKRGNMAKKHFDEYYNKLYKQYRQMLRTYAKFLTECANKMMSEEDVERFKQTMLPITDSFNYAVYIKYLLDLPLDQKKHNRCTKALNKLLEKLDDVYKETAIVTKNAAALCKAEDLI